jgi:hypothetical protein
MLLIIDDTFNATFGVTILLPLLSKQRGYSFHIKPRCVLRPHHERHMATHRLPNEKNIFNLGINGIKPQRRRAHGGLTKRLTNKQKNCLCLTLSGDGAGSHGAQAGWSNLCIQVENRAAALAVAWDRWCALVGGHACGRGDWKGGGKIIPAQRYCSDLQSQVRPGENFLSLR